eukprot:CAMPEP_0119417242 /NCGR_PEP_ID=MMETSP1335-20130426/15256_1 /TAXON_ID=259385 /ORGANISM="Chrysoculter rhomboideus, Strain RCC1486" /LENGTH=349 /DNA_ID=CAMNT_0007442409 /DNA_START=70 /DNA_END=1118 /DNA_ORIENTATION=-
MPTSTEHARGSPAELATGAKLARPTATLRCLQPESAVLALAEHPPERRWRAARAASHAAFSSLGQPGPSASHADACLKTSARVLTAARRHPARRAARPVPASAHAPTLSKCADVMLVHSRDELVDELLAVAGVAALDEVRGDLLEAARWRAQLEWPQEVVRLLERRPDSVDLVDEILDAQDVVLAERLLDRRVVGERDAVLARAALAEAALVDELTHRLQRRVAIGDVRLHLAQHVDRRLVRLEEDTIVDLAQPKQLQDLLGLRVHRVDAADANHEKELRLRLDEEVACPLRLAAQAHKLALLCTVLLHVRLCALEDRASLLDLGLLSLRRLRHLLRVQTLLRLALLQH